MDFIYRLFDTKDYPPRWDCGNWTVAEGYAFITADLCIFLAYYAIPFILIYFLKKGKFIHDQKILLSTLWLFALFILLCGTGHLVDAIMFYFPAYRFLALVHICTALVSLITVLHLFKVIPEFLEFPIALRKIEIWYAALLRGTLDPIIVINSYGIIQFTSDSAEDLFGWSPLELKGKNIKELMPELHSSAHDNYLDNYRKTGIPRELEAKHKDGTIFPCMISISQKIKVPGTEGEFFIGIVRDVTEKK